MVRTLFLLPGLFWATSVVAGQSDPPATPILHEEILVTEVLLDAIVTNREGGVAVGLGPEDFIVLDDGEEVEVTGVSFYSNRLDLDPERAASRSDLGPDGRYLIFFFHDRAYVDPRQRPRLMEAGRDVQRWIETRKLRNDWAAIVSFDYKLKVQQDFTRDPQALVEGAKRAVMGKDPGGNWPSRMPEAEAGPSLLRHLPEGKELRRKTTNVLDALWVLSDATGEVSTSRKVLYFISEGFEGFPSGVAQYRPDPRYYPRAMESLNSHNIAVYSLDLAPIGARTSTRQSLTMLSGDTDGRPYWDIVSFGNLIEKVAEENGGYYLLSYQASVPSGESGYRRVKISTRDPQYKVRGRRGYQYGNPPKP